MIKPQINSQSTERATLEHWQNARGGPMSVEDCIIIRRQRTIKCYSGLPKENVFNGFFYFVTVFKSGQYGSISLTPANRSRDCVNKIQAEARLWSTGPAPVISFNPPLLGILFKRIYYDYPGAKKQIGYLYYV